MGLQLIICHEKELLSSLSSIKLVLMRNKCYQGKLDCTGTISGAETRGDKSPPVIWLYPPPNSLKMVHICIPSNNLNGCTAERKFGEKKCSILAEDLLFFFFCSSPKIGERKCSISEEDLFFWSSPEFGEKKCSVCIFRLVFTKFPHLNKIEVEVHPPNVENRAKLG